ncbi:MAG TPA: hypothetical protein VK988_02070 [Acidimicrobiales bacterium]|nr:hypothetical protein [Acidimicrobiales bacterium]
MGDVAGLPLMCTSHNQRQGSCNHSEDGRQNLTCCLEHDQEIEAQRRFLEVEEVEALVHGERRGVTGLNLPQTGDSWKNEKPLAESVAEGIDLCRERRPRADHAHLAP